MGAIRANLNGRITYIYMLGSTRPNQEIVGPVVISPKGTYNLATSMKPESLKSAILIRAQPVFDIEIQKPILPHNSVEGWAIFDIAKGFTSPGTKIYKIAIRDSAGAVSSAIIKDTSSIEGRE